MAVIYADPFGNSSLAVDWTEVAGSWIETTYVKVLFAGAQLSLYYISNQQLNIIQGEQLGLNYKTATTYITRANYASKHSYEELGFKKCLKTIHLRPIDRKYFKVIK